MTFKRQTQQIARIMLVGLCMFGVMGCSSSKPEKNPGVDQITIVPKSNGNAVELNASAVYAIMVRCGFTDEQVYYHGTALRDAIKNHGGAIIFVGKGNAEVLLRVMGEEVQGVSQSYGYFVYDVKLGDFKMGGVSPVPKMQSQQNPMAPR